MNSNDFIPNQWYPILDAQKLTRRKPIGVKRLGERLVLWRDRSGSVACAIDRCSHRAAQLSLGQVRHGCLQCPYHGLRFNRDGECVLIPAYGDDAPIPHGFNVSTRIVREAHGLVWFWYGDPIRAASDLPWFGGAPENSNRSSTVEREYPFHYLRVMENFGDAHHVPFVHRWTFPGAGSRFELISAAEHDNVVTIDALMRGAGPRHFIFDFPFKASIRLPSLGLIEITPKLRFVATATPIDEARTWLWVRYEQAYVPGWLGGSAFARLAAWYDINLIFSWQDSRILQSQQLDRPGDISHYHLLEADRAIALYFAIRKRALAAIPDSPALVVSHSSSSSSNSA